MILTSTALAAAQPVNEPAEAHPEYAVRAGLHSTAMDLSDDAPAGTGFLLEGGAAWRFNAWLSLGAFSAFSRLHDSFKDPFALNKTYASTTLFFDLGVRFSLHWGGAFGGLGLGIEERREFEAWNRGPIGELHAGYRFPTVSWLHGAPELAAMFGRSTMTPDGYVNTTRLAIGVVF